jgi:hypothetical protein
VAITAAAMAIGSRASASARAATAASVAAAGSITREVG